MRLAARLFGGRLRAHGGPRRYGARAGYPFPSGMIRIYKAVEARTRITYGDLWLSDANARFDGLKGRMEIRYVETLPPSANPDLSGARIYQVLNFAQYFNFNRHKAGFCTLPVKWVGMRDLGNMQLRVTLMVMDDYRASDQGKPSLCIAATYRLPAQ